MLVFSRYCGRPTALGLLSAFIINVAQFFGAGQFEVLAIRELDLGKQLYSYTSSTEG